MTCRGQVSEFCRKCNPVHTSPKFYSTPGSCCFCFLTNLTLGVIRKMSEHIVVSSWLGTDDPFRTLSGIFCQSTSRRNGDNRLKFLIKSVFFENWKKMHFHLLILLLTVVADRTWCPPLLVLAQSFPQPSRIRWMVLPSCLVTATMGMKISMLHSIAFLPFDKVGVSPVCHE